MRNIVGIVVAFDHFLPSRFSPELYELHVVVQVEGESENIRLRTHYGAPLRAADFGVIAESEDYHEKLATVIDLFEIGTRLAMVVLDPLEEYRDPAKGYHSIDKVVDARCIHVAPQKVRQPANRSRFEVILGGKS